MASTGMVSGSSSLSSNLTSKRNYHRRHNRISLSAHGQVVQNVLVLREITPLLDYGRPTQNQYLGLRFQRINHTTRGGLQHSSNYAYDTLVRRWQATDPLSQVTGQGFDQEWNRTSITTVLQLRSGTPDHVSHHRFGPDHQLRLQRQQYRRHHHKTFRPANPEQLRPGPAAHPTRTDAQSITGTIRTTGSARSPTGQAESPRTSMIITAAWF
jgi:hypothetical protein